MNRIDELIMQHCPDGVHYQRLGDVLKIKNGKDHKGLADGDIPVYGSGGIMRYVDTASASGPSVLIPRKGSLGNIFYVEGPFWVVDTIFRTEIDSSLVEPKFIYYLLLTMKLGEMNQAGGVPSQTQTVLNSLRLPVPPLEVQRAIVEVLDTFSKLEAELEAELKARKQQYEHYRAELLSDNHEGDLHPLGEIFEMRAGTHVKAAEIADTSSETHPYPCFGGNGIRGFVANFNYDENVAFIGRQGALCGNVHRSEGRIYATEHAVVVTPKIPVDMSWAFHKLTEMDLNQYKTKSAQPGLAVGRIKELIIPLPPLDEQRRIVAILDKFEALVNGFSVGLPAELAARRQQYEYYRGNLLSFKEIG